MKRFKTLILSRALVCQRRLSKATVKSHSHKREVGPCPPLCDTRTLCNTSPAQRIVRTRGQNKLLTSKFMKVMVLDFFLRSRERVGAGEGSFTI